MATKLSQAVHYLLVNLLGFSYALKNEDMQLFPEMNCGLTNTKTISTRIHDYDLVNFSEGN